MASQDSTDKVKDKEYTNWLKVTLALYYMKSGLHTFIQSEIECLHRILVKKIYAGQPVRLSPCTTCNASLVRRNKHTSVWKFQDQCKSSCDVWFHELLALHTNPNSKKIYWNNSYVPSWPFKPWECAKIFMPRRWLPSNAGPEECDAQALLMLLARCTHFHSKLSRQGIVLTNTISAIQNKVIHASQMKLSDADRMSFIQQIIQFLEDPVHLKTLEDCKTAVSSIHKIDNDLVDVFFNLGQEMTALRAVVKELRQEHGMQETKNMELSQECGMQETENIDYIDSLKEEYRQLIRDAENEVKLHGQGPCKVVKKVSHRERFGIVPKNVELHGTRLGAVEEIVELHETNLYKWIAQMENYFYMKVLKDPPKRRPESDGLKQLKSQTEDMLDTFRRLGCISTTQTAKAKILLEDKRSVVIIGNPGEGKTTIALHLIDDEMYRDRHVLVYSPREWKTVDIDWVDIVVLEDMLGKYDFDPSCLQEWMVYLPTIQEHVDAGKLRVIITTRTDILAKAYSKLGSLKLLSDHMSLTLSSEYLSNSEKMSILNRELQRNNKNMKEHEIEQCITNFSGLIGFPECCLLFAADSKLFDRGPEFFRSPKELFFVNIRELEAEKFISLAFLFCHGEIFEEYLSPETMPKSSNDLFMELASCLHISKKKADITLLRDAYETFGGMYIEKSISDEIISGVSVKKPYVCFSHATVCEAVGKVLANHSLEIVVKHGDPEYLYQRTYTAEAKDKTSENLFLPVSMYSILAERMIHDVLEKGNVKSVVKHSALKQYQFVMKLKDKLHKGNRIKDFLMAESRRDFLMAVPYSVSRFGNILSEGECITFMQYILQCDTYVVRLVYSHFMEFLACIHNNKTSDCWQCEAKQDLLELALFYHHFEIADRLIAMNARYTHVSLCNAARHGHLRRVQTIMETLKRSKVFNPDCYEAKDALFRAYISGHQSLIELLLQERIVLNSWHVIDAVQHGTMNVLMKVVEHLKLHNEWKPHWERYGTHGPLCLPSMFLGNIRPQVHVEIPCSTALYITYCKERFDMADYLRQNEVNVSLDMLPCVSKYSSLQAVARVIHNLKVIGAWDPHCDDASEALNNSCCARKYDVCDLLIQNGVSMSMKNLSGMAYTASLESVSNAIKHIKDAGSWDPNCDDASRALENAYRANNYGVCDLLSGEGVSLTMKNIPKVMEGFEVSLEVVEKLLQHLKTTNHWDPKCDNASKALEKAYRQQKYDVCNLLIQEEVSLTMKNLPGVMGGFKASLETVKRALQHLKDTGNWDPKGEDAYEALDKAYREEKYDVCDLLVKEGVLLSMKQIPQVTLRSLNYMEMAVKLLKDVGAWDSKCHYASEALTNAYRKQKYDVCDLLVHEGVFLTMKDIPWVSLRSLDYMEMAVKLLKDVGAWDPKCHYASEALANAYRKQKYDVCDLLVHEGVILTMKVIPWMISRSLNYVKAVVKEMKATDNWDPRCEYASEALENAYSHRKYDVCNFLIHEGVSQTMKYFPRVILRSLNYVKTAIKQMKATDNWDPKCEYASEALENACRDQKYDVCDLLIQEGVSMTMKYIPHMMLRSLDHVKKVVRQLKDTDSWDPKCDYASEALENAYLHQKYDVCDLLVQEGVLVTMKHFPNVVLESMHRVKTSVQQLKDFGNWDPMCNYASEALANAYLHQKYDVCDLLVQEGVLLTMKLFQRVLSSISVVRDAIQHLKDTDIWNPKSADASEALRKAYIAQNYDVFDLLICERVSMSMKNLPDVVVYSESLQSVKKVIQNLKDTFSWDPKCNDASKALASAYSQEKYDVCDLLIQNGVTLTMKDLPGVVVGFQVSLESLKKSIQHLKDTDIWEPKSDDASKALENAFSEHKYDVCDLLVQMGVSLKMKNLLGVLHNVSLESIKKVIKHLKDTDNWDPNCGKASKALASVYSEQNFVVSDLLVCTGVSLQMKHLSHVLYSLPLKAVAKVIQDLQNKDSWDPTCDDAVKALEIAYTQEKYDVCDLLIEKGVSLSTKHLPRLLYILSLESFKKIIQHLKNIDSWDPKCDDASKALENANREKEYEICDLLIQEGVILKESS